MSQVLLTRREGAVLVLSNNNVAARNALSPEFYAAVTAALREAAADPAVGAIVLTGEGGHFCAGGDLRQLAKRRELPVEERRAKLEGLHDLVRSLRDCPKPVIAAVEGPAAGAGFSLALACDMIVAARNSVFVMAYSSIALSPDGGGSWGLSRAVPRQLATELLMCGERIGAERLQQLGVVNRLTEPAQALNEALKLATTLNGRAPNALASAKELLADADGSTLNAQLARERDHFVKNLHHANAGIGIAAFLNKQTPQYE